VAGDAAAAFRPEQAGEPGNDAAPAGERVVFKFVRPERQDARQLRASAVSREIRRSVEGAGARWRAVGAFDVRHDRSVV